jgi:hypothetical protein
MNWAYSNNQTIDIVIMTSYNYSHRDQIHAFCMYARMQTGMTASDHANLRQHMDIVDLLDPDDYDDDSSEVCLCLRISMLQKP